MELDANGTPTGLPYGDYHLQGISGAIDGALTNDPAFDIDGDARPQGGASDIGADEYVAPGAAMQSRGPRSQEQLLSSESAE